MSATEAKKGTSEKANKAFDDAVSELVEYEKKNYSKKTVAERIKKAEEADKSSLKFLNSLKEKFSVREELITLLHRTLTLVFSHWWRDRRQKSTFISTSPFQIKNPLL
jgi:hypothetical protein